MATELRKNTKELRYELLVDGELAALIVYGKSGDLLALTHTETRPGFERQGLAKQLVAYVVDDAQAQGLGILPFCPFVASYLAKDPELVELVPEHCRDNFKLTAPAN